MTTLFKHIATVLFFILAVMLIGWSASRGLDFIQTTLPEGQKTSAYFGLAGTEVGMIIWLLVFMYAARSIGQYVVAGLMTLVDLAGAIALFSFDTLMRAGENGMIATLSPDEVRTVIIGLNLLIAANVIATVGYHLAESETQKRISESVMQGLLELKVMRAIEKKGQAIVDEQAPQIAEQYLEEFKGRFANANALGLSINCKKEDKSAEWLDWRTWLDDRKAMHNVGSADKTGSDSTIYQAEVPSPLSGAGEGNT